MSDVASIRPFTATPPAVDTTRRQINAENSLPTIIRSGTNLVLLIRPTPGLLLPRLKTICRGHLLPSDLSLHFRLISSHSGINKNKNEAPIFLVTGTLPPLRHWRLRSLHVQLHRPTTGSAPALRPPPHRQAATTRCHPIASPLLCLRRRFHRHNSVRRLAERMAEPDQVRPPSAKHPGGTGPQVPRPGHAPGGGREGG